VHARREAPIAAYWSGTVTSRSQALRNKAAQVLKAGRKDAAARGYAGVATIFTALADSYKRQARLNEQARDLLAMPPREATEPEAT
jgi:hypothetical protein